MTQRKQSPEKVLWPHLVQIPIVLAGFAVLGAIWFDMIAVVPGIAVFLGLVLVSAFVNYRAMHSYQCPTCRRHLTPPKHWWFRFAGVPILLYCRSCDVDWDFGLTGHTD